MVAVDEGSGRCQLIARLQGVREEPERFKPSVPDVLPEVEMEQLVVEAETPKVSEEIVRQELFNKRQKLIDRQEEFLDLSTFKISTCAIKCV